MADEVKDETKKEESFEEKTGKALDLILAKLEATENKTKELENKIKTANLYRPTPEKEEPKTRLIDDIK